MKRFLAILTLTFLMACKSKAPIAGVIKPQEAEVNTNVIANYNKNTLDFSTLYIKSSVAYSDNKQNQNVTAEIKIKKDQQILVSVRFLGITMAKASITPTSVSYYEKIGSNYFEGDFSTLSQWLGTDLDYHKIQNMLLGRAIEDLGKEKYTESFADQVYKLEEQSSGKFKKSFYIDAGTFTLNKQEVQQTDKERMIDITYSNNKIYKEGILPANVLINAIQPKGNAKINFEYNSITFNEELSFPYSVPNGYKRIIIK